jgi:hypothetical protein
MSTLVYICGPMTGIKEHNIPAFNDAEKSLRALGYKVLNPAIHEAPDSDKATWEWYMRSSIRMVTRADGIALLSGWGKSKGAILEYQIGHGLGMKVQRLEQWLEWAI